MTDPTKLHNKNRGDMKLIVWQRAIDLFELIFRTVFKETAVDFKLRSQLVDAAQSVSGNIAEGYGRRFASENRLSRLIEKLEQKKDNDDWISRISGDPEEYRMTPSFHHSTTPSKAAHA